MIKKRQIVIVPGFLVLKFNSASGPEAAKPC